MIELKVPTIDSSEAADRLKETILTSEPDAKVEIDTDTRKVTVESKASAETFIELIEAEGHKIEE